MTKGWEVEANLDTKPSAQRLNWAGANRGSAPGTSDFCDFEPRDRPLWKGDFIVFSVYFSEK